MNNVRETSAGAVIYKIENNIPLFLLVYSARNKEWGFAKGHIEPGETEQDAAKREIFEETGISDIKFIDSFRETDAYKIKGTLPDTVGRIITKNVIYYLCYTNSNFVCSEDKEIGSWRWLSYEQAYEILKYKLQKEILSKANRFIKEEVK